MKKQLLRHLIFFVLLTVISSQITAQSNKPVRLNHIALYVKNLQASTQFYMKVVGLDTMPEPFHDGRHTWYPVGEHSQLHLISGAKEITQHDKNAHLCFTVRSVDDFVKVLVASQVPYENWAGQKSSITTRIDGVKQVYFQDPDNYWVEINDDKY
ncbi:MAG: Glyoxalase/bleomycin resistance protein/dioxygenase [Segetibacter sp.]|jgi:lactoylglutathione lyase|nr:Glyoxalase/bleomycin resistance protein/dioxygenase [Segetibacter sp.]